MKLKDFVYLIGKREYVKERINPFALLGAIVFEIALIAGVLSNIGTSLFVYFLGLWIGYTLIAGFIIWLNFKNVQLRLKRRDELIKKGEKLVGQIITWEKRKIKGVINRYSYNVLVKFRYGLDDRLAWSDELDFNPADLKTSKVDVYILDGEYIFTHFSDIKYINLI